MARLFSKVAVLMGGPSSEREVSLRSGTAVVKGLKEAGYEAEGLDVDGTRIDLPNGTEAVFIALHGEFGEDGGVQSLLDEMGMPYAGSNAESSRIAFDKVLSKKVLVDGNVPTPAYEVLREGDKRTLSLPVVVKPARQGSSIGIHRVLSEGQWDAAINDAFSFGNEVIVEEYIKGRELTVGIVGRSALPVVEIVAPDDWYDYRAKYTKGESRYLVPAPVDASCAEKCQQLALQTHDIMGCRGFSRVDFRISENGGFFVLELNSIPGFTETSLLPKAAAESGMTFSDLCDRIMKTIE